MKVSIISLMILSSVQAGHPQGQLPPPIPLPAPLPTDLYTAGPYFLGGGISRNLRQRVRWEPGSYGMTMFWSERSPSTQDPWYKDERAVNTAFRFVDVSTREGGNEVYVAGLRDNGTGVVRRFTFPLRTGGIRIRTAPLVIAPIGTPLPDHVAVEDTLGGTFSPSTMGSHADPVKKTLLNNQLGLIRCLEIDAYGRFLLLLPYDDSKLYRLNLHVLPNTLEVLYDESDLPTLSDVRSMATYRRGSGGQVFILSTGYRNYNDVEPTYVVLRDDDNDGEIDAIENYTSNAHLNDTYGVDGLLDFWTVDLDLKSW